jgi:hypothetical protein
MRAMSQRGQVAYDPRGRIFVVTHDEALLVHDGDSEAPLWQETIDETIAGVAIAGDEIVVLGEEGAVRRFTFLHRELARASLGGPVRTFAVREDGTIVGAHEDHVSLLRRNDLAAVPLYHRGVTALAWSRDGKRVLVGKSSPEGEHQLVLLDGANGEPQGAPQTLASAITAIASCPKGFFVANGDRIQRFTQPDAPLAHVTRAREHVITDVACSAEGTRLAMQIDRSRVLVLDDPPGEALLDVSYPQRVCSGVAFGPRPWIAIALAGGDANRVNVDTGAMHRSDTHPGRQHNRWLVSVAGAFQKRAAPAPTAAPAKTAGIDEAKLEQQRRAQRAIQDAEAQLRQQQQDDSDRKMMFRIGFIVLGILLGVLRACARDSHHY